MQVVNEDDLYEKNCNYIYVDMRELNGLSLVYAMARSIWRQAITQINADVYWHLDPWNKIRWNFDQNTYIMSNQENADEKSSAKWQSFFFWHIPNYSTDKGCYLHMLSLFEELATKFTLWDNTKYEE